MNNIDEKIDPADGQSNGNDIVPSTYIRPQDRKVHDPDVPFEEYHYYALKTREQQRSLEPPKLNWREIVLRKKATNEIENEHIHVYSDEKVIYGSNRVEITDEEWTNASRAFRTASTGACELNSRYYND